MWVVMKNTIKLLSEATRVDMSLPKFGGICASLVLAGFMISNSYNGLTTELRDINTQLALRPTATEFSAYKEEVAAKFAENDKRHVLYDDRLHLVGSIDGRTAEVIVAKKEDEEEELTGGDS